MIHLIDKTKVNGVRCNRVRWGIGLLPDGSIGVKGVNCKKCLGLPRRANSFPAVSTVGMDLVGKILHTSWGYDMTINNFAKVVGMTPKGVKCVMIGARVVDDYGKGDGKAFADPSIVTSPVFVLKVSKDTMGNPMIKGSYPFCDNSKRKGYFTITDSAKGHYHNTWD